MIEIEPTEEVKDALCGDLATLDLALFYLLLMIAGSLLSFQSVVMQRQALVLALEGKVQEAQALPDVYPLKMVSSSIFLGSLGFFLQLSIQTAQKAADANADIVTQRSAQTNQLASLLFFIASALRHQDLIYVHNNRDLALAAQVPVA